ncbi:MAG: xanthine dehydrogenase family protein subunit M [Polyangia bacterium]|nr:xanthine dehydrogenase family protein subunit M [Polyangia bacterium]
MFATLSHFDLLEPASEAEAAGLLAARPGSARVLAGGCDLLPELRRRRARPEALVSLGRIESLRGLQVEPSGLTIRAMATLWEVERALADCPEYAALHDGIHSLASVQVKTTGTLVGNLCVATPASDIAPPLIALDATLRILGDGGEGRLPLFELATGPKRHCLGPGELVTRVEVPRPPAGSGSAFAKLTRTAADIAKLNVAAWVRVEGGRCAEARILLGALAPTPVRAVAAEEALVGGAIDASALDRAAALVVEAIRPITDLRSTAEYRLEVAPVLARRVLELAFARALGGEP